MMGGQHFFEHFFVDLTGSAFRYAFQKMNFSRDFISRQTRSKIGYQLLWGNIMALGKNHCRSHLFPPFWVRGPENRHSVNCLMSEEGLFNFPCRDIFPATHNDVFFAVDDI